MGVGVEPVECGELVLLLAVFAALVRVYRYVRVCGNLYGVYNTSFLSSSSIPLVFELAVPLP